MAKDAIDMEKARYIIRYYSELMTADERYALSSMFVREKTNDNEVLYARLAQRLREGGLLKENQAVDDLLKDGAELFYLATAQRILQEHAGKLIFNHCPQCGKLARTPVAKQYRFCGKDWH